MSKLPQIKRLVLEDFPEQKGWISRLFMPLNTFMESVFTALNRNLTVVDNMAADIRTVEFTSVPTALLPLPLSWSLKSPPVAIHVGQVARKDAASFTLAAAVQVQWVWTPTGLQITNLLGVTPTTALPYNITLVIFTG